MRPTMTVEEKQAIRQCFGTKTAWQRHIAAVLDAERQLIELIPQERTEDFVGDLESATADIRTSLGKRDPAVLGEDFIRDAELLFNWKRRRGKRLYRRYMQRHVTR